MAKYDPESLKFPEFREEPDKVFTKDKIDEMLNKLKLMDPSYNADEVRRNLDVCDSGINMLREKIKKYDNIDKNLQQKAISKKKTKKVKASSDKEENKSFLESKKQMSDYLMKEKRVCDDLENKLKVIQETLDGLDLGKTKEGEEDLKLYADSKSAIEGVISDFSALEDVLKIRIDEDLDEDSLSDYEEDLKELRSVQRETEKVFDFYLDI